MKQEITKLLKTLVECESFVSESKYQKILTRWIQKNLPGFTIREFPVEKNRKNILAYGNKPIILLACHMDTVRPTKGSEAKLRQAGDKLYGLGTKDMKGGTVAALIAAKYLPLEVSEKIGFLFYCDEEYCQKGMEAMVKKSSLIPKTVKYFLCPESRFNLSFASRGVAVFDIEFLGKSAHSARPHLGINAIEEAFRFFAILRSALGKFKSSLNLASLNGSTDSNRVPDLAKSTGSIRIGDEKLTEKALLQIIKDIIKKNNFQVKFSITTFRSAIMPKSKAHIKKFLSAAKGFDIKLADPMLAGYNDICMLSSKLGIPFWGFGPYGENNHGPNEWVSLQSIKECIEVYQKLAKKI